MKSRTFLAGIIGIMLVCGACGVGTVPVNAQNAHTFMKKSFNMDYPVYGIDLMGYTKSPKIQDLTLPDNFITGGNRSVICEEAGLNKDGDEYTIKLLLNTGLTRTARLEIKLKSDTVTQRNCVTALSFYDFSTRKEELITYSGREQMLERLITRYVELLEIFYNKNRLVS